jgi:hypothetical protein
VKDLLFSSVLKSKTGSLNLKRYRACSWTLKKEAAFFRKFIFFYNSVRGHNSKYHNLNNCQDGKPMKTCSVQIENYTKINLELNTVDSKQVSYRLQPVSGKEINVYKSNLVTRILILVYWWVGQ